MTLPDTLAVPVISTPVVEATNTLEALGAKAIAPDAPVIRLNAPVSTMLPVTFKLPPLILPVALINPAVLMFAPVTLPLALATPVVNVPVLATVNTLDVPAMLIPILPFVAAAMFDVPAVTGNPDVEAATPVS